MRNIVRSLALLLILSSYAWATQLASDDFNRSDDTDLGAQWTQYTGAGHEPCQLLDNAVRPTTLNSCSEAYTTVLPADQWASGLISTLTGDGNVGVQVRGSTDFGDVNFYGCFVETGLSVLFKVTSNSYFELASSAATSWSAGDRLRLDANGTALGCKKDGVSAVSGRDSDHTGTGYPGINLDSGSDLANSVLDDFTAGDFASTARRRVIIVE